MANLRPQGPLFDAASTAASRMALRAERARVNGSYLAAAMLSIPIGLLPSTLRDSLADILNGPLHGNLFRIPNPGADGALYLALALLISLAFIVTANVLADRQYNQMLELSSRLLSSSTLSMLVLDDSNTQELLSGMRGAILRETLSISGGKTVSDQAAFYGLYHDYYHRKARGLSKEPPAMLVRQDAMLNLLLAFLTSLSCLALFGYLLLPFVLLRIFRNWPRATACQTAFAHYISQRDLDR